MQSPFSLETNVVFKQAGAVVKAEYQAINEISNYTLNIGFDNDYNLTIPPGAYIEFAPGFKIELFGWHQLNILGTPDNPVTLTSNGMGNWEGIVVRNDGELNIENVYIRNSNVGLRFNFWDNITNNPPDKHINKVNFAYNEVGILIELFNYGSFAESNIYVNECNFTDNQYGIKYFGNEQNGPVPYNDQIDAYILNSYFYSNAIGIYIQRNAHNVEVLESNFYNNQKGIYINLEWPSNQQLTHYFYIGRSLFTNNDDGIYSYTDCYSGQLVIRNNTFYNNTFSVFSPITEDQFNSFAYNNIVSDGDYSINLDFGDQVHHNDFWNISGNYYPQGGEGNISSDPLFIDPVNGDFHLQPGSPCIDAGDPDSPLDPDGTTADMGAFYYTLLTPELSLFGDVGEHPVLTWEMTEPTNFSHYEVWRYYLNIETDGSIIATQTENQYVDTDFVISFVEEEPDGKKKYYADPIGYPSPGGFHQKVKYRVKAFDTQQHHSELSNEVYTYRLLPGPIWKQADENKALVIPDKYALYNNYPNPFNSTTMFRYDLPEISYVTIIIYDLLGRKIIELENGKRTAGFYTTIWNGKDNSGNPISSGMYIYRFNAKSLDSDKQFHKTKKMVLLR